MEEASSHLWFLRKHQGDRKSTRLNSSRRCISYAVFCLKKKILASSLWPRAGRRPGCSTQGERHWVQVRPRRHLSALPHDPSALELSRCKPPGCPPEPTC